MKNATGNHRSFTKRARVLGPILFGACLSLFAWQSLPGAEIERVAVESNDLGISSVEIENRLQNGDRLLVIRGLDKGGKEIAIASLRAPGARSTAELRLTVGEERGFSLVPRGLGTREVLEPPQASLAGFIRLPAVAAVLAEQAGIRFVQPEKKVTGATPCSGNNFPSNIANAPECCQDGEFLWQIVGSGADIGKVGKRMLGSPCRQANGSKNCGVGSNPFVQCYFGPCGAAKVWVAGITPSHVFVPNSQPKVCGWDTNGDPVPEEGGATYSPEPYTGQTLYPGVIATCPYRDCLPDGTPVVTGFALTVTAVKDGATGDVTSKFPGISIAGAGVDSWGYEGGAEVTLTADPVGKNARAVFSGDCTESGRYGKKATCTLTMNATSAVTVTYQCEPGFTCQQ